MSLVDWEYFTIILLQWNLAAVKRRCAKRFASLDCELLHFARCRSFRFLMLRFPGLSFLAWYNRFAFPRVKELCARIISRNSVEQLRDLRIYCSLRNCAHRAIRNWIA